ncbi:tetratricopeptide repeat protein, partial [candidate division TA06 bacterium]|nr:tetratricopeptide repeat protein [candidate division TA06 bacterium]
GQLEGFRVLTGLSSDTERRSFHPIRQILMQLQVEGNLPIDPQKSESDAPNSGQLPEEVEKWRIFDEVAGIFLKHQEPLLLLLDDFHLADTLTQDLMAFLARSLCKRVGRVDELMSQEAQNSQNSKTHTTAVIIVVAYESNSGGPPETFLQGTRGIEDVKKINLKNLSPEETRILFTHLLAKGEGLEEVVDWIHHQTGGFPLLIEETTKWLIAEGILKWRRRRWTFHKDLVGEGLKPAPTEIEGLISQTLSRLDETTMTLLEDAAVLGDLFPAHLLKELTSLSDQNLFPLLTHLEREHLLRREPGPGDLYAFSHHWLRQILYERIDPQSRRESHRKILRALEKTPKDGNEVALAYHAIQGEIREKSLQYGMKAGELAERSYNHRGALELYEKLLPLSEENGLELNILEKMGDLYEKVGDYEKSLTHYSRALQLEKRKHQLSRLHFMIGTVERKRSRYSEALGAFDKGFSLLEGKKSSEGISLLNGMGWIYREQGDYEKATETLSRAERMARETNDREGLSLSLRNLATVYWNQSNFKEAIAVGEKGLSIAKENQDDYQIATACNNLGIFYWNLGESEEAKNYYLKSLEIRKKIGDIHGIGLVHINIGILDQDKRMWEDASQHFEKSLEIFERLNDRLNLARLRNSFGLLCFALGKWDKSFVHFNKGIEIAKDLGNKILTSAAYHNLGRLYLYQGDLDKANENLETALSAREEIGDAEGEAASLLNIAILKTEKEDWEKANAILERTEKIYKEKGTKSNLSFLLQTRSLVHLKKKEIEKAFQYVEEGLVVAIKQKNEDDIGSSHRILGEVYAEIGENEKALDNYSKSIEVLEKAINRYELAQTLIALAHFHLSHWQKTQHT